MKLGIIPLLLMLMLLSFVAKSQDSTTINSSKWDVGLEGMVGVSFGRDFYSVNVGGPAFFLVLNKDLKLSVGALPSLYLFEGKTRS